MAAFATDAFDTPARQNFVEMTDGRANGVRRANLAGAPAVFSAAAKSAEFADRMRSHFRETRRIAVEIPCSIELILMDGTICNSGSAVVRNVSPSGALVASMNLEQNSLPAALFKVRMILQGEPYAGIGIEATPVRFSSGNFGLGVKFDEIFVAV
jgi:hypothetical protein